MSESQKQIHHSFHLGLWMCIYPRRHIHFSALTCRDDPVKFAAAGDHVTGSIHGVDMAHVR